MIWKLIKLIWFILKLLLECIIGFGCWITVGHDYRPLSRDECPGPVVGDQCKRCGWKNYIYMG